MHLEICYVNVVCIYDEYFKDLWGLLFLLLIIAMNGGIFFFFYIEVYDFLNIVKSICLLSLLTIHDKAPHNKGNAALELKKRVGIRV